MLTVENDKYGDALCKVVLLRDITGLKEALNTATANTGIGISRDHMEHLFMPFHKVESGATRNYGGTGLGLPISKNIVEMMSGRIWVESKLGKGSTFSFTAKFILDPELESEIITDIPEIETDEDQQIITNTFEGHCILLVEDVDINREIVIALLEATLVEIECADNGAEAVEMYSKSPDKYDLIFMDLQMPVMDGYEATRKIRALGTDEAENIPIIAMTANAFKEDVEKCLISGMNDHIGKPINVDTVIDLLRYYLK